KQSQQRQGFVLIPGYNVDFPEAAEGCGQMAFDLGLDVVRIMHRWPSMGDLGGYVTGFETTAPGGRQLALLMRDVAQRSAADQSNSIAHSMGARVRALAMESMTDRGWLKSKPPFKNVVLAAPDICAPDFLCAFGPTIAACADQVVIYASSDDDALKASKTVH